MVKFNKHSPLSFAEKATFRSVKADIKQLYLAFYKTLDFIRLW